MYLAQGLYRSLLKTNICLQRYELSITIQYTFLLHLEFTMITLINSTLTNHTHIRTVYHVQRVDPSVNVSITTYIKAELYFPYIKTITVIDSVFGRQSLRLPDCQTQKYDLSTMCPNY